MGELNSAYELLKLYLKHEYQYIGQPLLLNVTFPFKLVGMFLETLSVILAWPRKRGYKEQLCLVRN